MTVHDSNAYEEELPPYEPVPKQWVSYFGVTQMGGLWPGNTEKMWAPITPTDAAVELRNSMRKQLHKVPCDLPKEDIKLLENIIYDKYGYPAHHDKTNARAWLAHTTHEITVAIDDIVSGHNNSQFPELVNAIRCLKNDSAWKYYKKLPKMPLPALNNKTFFKFGGVENPTTMPEKQIFTARTIPGHKLTYAMQAISGLWYAYRLEHDGVVIFNKTTATDVAKENNMAVHDSEPNSVPCDVSYFIEPATHRIISNFKSPTRNQKETSMNTNNTSSSSSNTAATAADDNTQNVTDVLNAAGVAAATAKAAEKVSKTAEKFAAEFSKDGVKTSIHCTSEKETTLKDKALAVGKFGLKVGVVAGVAYGAYKGVQFIRKGGAVSIVAAGEGAVPVIAGGISENATAVVSAFKAVAGLFKRG